MVLVVIRMLLWLCSVGGVPGMGWMGWLWMGPAHSRRKLFHCAPDFLKDAWKPCHFETRPKVVKILSAQ